MKIIFSIISFIILGFYGCTDGSNKPTGPSGNSNGDYFIFGHFYGECGGDNCVEIFKLQGDSLYEDRLDKYPSLERMPYVGSYYYLDCRYIGGIKALSDSIPAELLEQANQVFGTPDAHDQGGLILQIKKNGKVQYWLIDTFSDSLPVYLRPYAAKIEEMILKIYDK